ncbi:hypothetical protein B0H17DRAFT_1136758 [Mycena rosella]|uniref:Pentatricopeptide repeat protein n=1 Tax=Mycena rosella TaxID=1033263 RepID=A0AAD7D9X5_MYCRO|nr:hypothetical protein B0H17DRAFT_1136758 [Mycena rosella]
MFTPSTDMSAGFRFPPFPLALVEVQEAEPKNSAEAEHETGTEIFESPSVEYSRVYERLPKPSADILTQVVRFLPEMLPELETDSASIFEDKSDIDYAASSFSPADPFTSAESLENMVAERHYEQAWRILHELLEFGTEIPFSAVYEEAALAALKVEARTKPEIDNQIQRFKQWFSLIPPADQSPPRKFGRLRARILLSPLISIQLLMEFGLIAAEKGFATNTYSHVIPVVAMYGDPDNTIQFVDEIRLRNRTFLERTCPADTIDRKDRTLHVDIIGVAVRQLARARRFDHAMQLIPDHSVETDFHLSSYTYNFLIHQMKMTQDSRYRPYIESVAEHKSEAQFRSLGSTNMGKDKLALAIRYLADEGELDLALGLLPNLKEAGAALVAPTLDVLHARLRGSGDDRYLPHIELVSQLRNAAPSCATETSESEGTQPTVDVEKDAVLGDVIEALTRAWCLDEAWALMPLYHRNNTQNIWRIYRIVRSRLKAASNPKYHARLDKVTRMMQEVRSAARRGTAPTLEGAFTAEDYCLASSYPSSDSAAPAATLGAALRALRRGFRSYSHSRRPNALIVVRFMELYLNSGRRRAIPMLRNFVLRTKKTKTGHGLYIFAEMLFHTRNRNPELVIHTFSPTSSSPVFRATTSSCDSAKWSTTQSGVSMGGEPSDEAVPVSAPYGIDLYAKLLKSLDMRSTLSSQLHPGLPFLDPPPLWKPDLLAFAFTPFMRRISLSFGAERGALILQDMLKLGITPQIYQLTELAMAYSRAGDVTKTFAVMNRVEAALDRRGAPEKWDVAAAESTSADEYAWLRAMRSARKDTIPEVDPVFYRAVIRGFLKKGQLPAARYVQRRMDKRFGYVPGEDPRTDELYEDLGIAEGGDEVPEREPFTSVAYTTGYQTHPEKVLPSPPHPFRALTTPPQAKLFHLPLEDFPHSQGPAGA